MIMLFGKKEDKSRLPDLPPLPSLPSKNMEMESAVPEFPEAPEERPMPKPMNQPMQPKKPKVVEMEEWHPSNQMKFKEEEELEEEANELQEEPEEIYVQKKQTPRMIAQPQTPADVFVRIDKFHSARKALSEVQHKLVDIDELVKRIRDTKLREEQELAGWEKDILHIKSRVQTVTENIFEKVE
jgi:hypothetical protein